ncbi:uncharacterized protein LOC111674820 isoform X2 [Lucilia cuprina]|uniref:uncharacterized protein LOC111674820 isoform X2 n=1 Tax=Lucilia cuprina TaxID=7375 RepID=UPI001F064CDA|nr:uncharacterized protein LOC111674820 isoform X2 [Lucilia cuprina]
MAAPFNLEDLAKLKSFVEFVAANPAILNLPQLDFLKKLIEQLGGKVPEGTFQMPAGAKCPFGGDVKSENKPTPASAEAEVDEEEIPEMEAESEESEVELDMEANNMTVLEPNIIYLDEKPPKIVKTKKQKTSRKSPKKKHSSKVKTKLKHSTNTRKRSGKSNQDNVIKKEFCGYEEQEDKMENNDPNDPLYTAKLEIKCELSEGNQNDNIELNCDAEEQDDFDNDDDQDQNYKYEHETLENKWQRSDDDDDEEEEDEDDDDDDYDDNDENDDEPLIVLARRKGRPRKKQPEPDDEKNKAPRDVVCREICKQRCTEKFTDQERKDICDYYWNLNKDDRLVFIRKHIRARRLTRMIRVNANRIRGNNCCYYLKTYKIGCEDTAPESSAGFIRVCRKFFEATLCTTNHFIKKANDGTVMEIEKDLHLLNQMWAARKKEKEENKEPQQILDPETGNLITLDSKTNKAQKPKEKTSENKTETKRQRRKPGDPEPEHFPKPIKCALRCIHKCHTKFTEQERKQICDFFWSMDYKRRKDFILANMEIKDIETQTTPDFRKTDRPPRSYQTRFYMRSGGMRGENLRVCKDFYAKTLCINRYFIKNAIEFADKTTGYYTGSDRRGAHMFCNKVSEARRKPVLEHIDSYPFWIPNKKSKTKYLHYSLTIKKMHEDYKEKCIAENKEFVNLHYYYKTFHIHTPHLLFLANPHPKKGGGFLKANPNISHYTGEEPGGSWVDSKGNKLDLRSINPAKTLDSIQHNTSEDISQNTTFASGSTDAHNVVNVSNPAPFVPLKSTANQTSSLAVVRPDLNPTLYSNFTQDPINMFRMF